MIEEKVSDDEDEEGSRDQKRLFDHAWMDKKVKVKKRPLRRKGEPFFRES